MRIPSFSVASKAPISVSIDVAPVVNAVGVANGVEPATYGPPDVREYLFPLLRRRDWKAWRQQVDAERIEQIERVGVTPEQTARLLLLYPLAPLTHRELQSRVSTVEGTGYVFETCARAAGVPEHAIARVVEDGDADEMDLERLAYMLAGIIDPVDVAKALAEQEKKRASEQGGSQNDAPPRHPRDDEESEKDPFSGKAGGSTT